MKFVFLHRKLSPYWISCLRELKNQGNEIFIVAYSFSEIAPFEIESLEDIGEILDRSLISKKDILNKIKKFNPDAIIVSGWKDNLYLNICRYFKKNKTQIILTFDTQLDAGFNSKFLRGRLVVKFIIFLLKIYLKGAISRVWVPGQRQIKFAKALGFRDKNCWDGLYSCDLQKFSKISIIKNDTKFKIKEKTFLFVGRYVNEKGLDLLVDAYSHYKLNKENPWKLICAGGGTFPVDTKILNIENKGFIQPKYLNDLLLNSSALILPSRYEPWGVIVHEAAAAGLPIIISDACGSSDHLVKDGYNGYIFSSGDYISLAYKMRLLSNQSDEEIRVMGLNSKELSKSYSTQKWVKTLVGGLNNINKNA